MNYAIALITFGLLILLIVLQLKTWRTRALLSPAFYFAAIWVMGVGGALLLSPVGLLHDRYPKYIDELNIFVAFTALCFILFTPKGITKINKNEIPVNFISRGIFKVLGVIVTIVALYDFIRLGGNLNMGEARSNLQDIQAGQSVLVGYSQLISISLSIYAGYILLKMIKEGKKIRLSQILSLTLPLFANLIFSVNVGGRVNFVYAFVYYLFGAAFAIPYNSQLKQLKKPLTIISVCALSVLLFINLVAHQRQVNSYGEMSEVEGYLRDKNPVLGVIYAPIQYVGETYIGYQYRRLDAVDENQLGFGMYTFNGFINWTLPFAGRVGLGNASIASVLGIYYNPQETYDFKREFFYMTHSCYLSMYKDFGFWGTLLCIFFLTMIAQNLFVRLQMRRSINFASSLFLFFIFWEFWAKSNFYGTLSGAVLVPLYGFLLIDLLKLSLAKR